LNGKQITSAKLRLYDVDPASKGGNFYLVSDNSWQDGIITWNNAPVALTNLLASLGSVSVNNWYEVDLTSFITGDGTIVCVSLPLLLMERITPLKRAQTRLNL